MLHRFVEGDSAFDADQVVAPAEEFIGFEKRRGIFDHLLVLFLFHQLVELVEFAWPWRGDVPVGVAFERHFQAAINMQDNVALGVADLDFLTFLAAAVSLLNLAVAALGPECRRQQQPGQNGCSEQFFHGVVILGL